MYVQWLLLFINTIFHHHYQKLILDYMYFLSIFYSIYQHKVRLLITQNSVRSLTVPHRHYQKSHRIPNITKVKSNRKLFQITPSRILINYQDKKLIVHTNDSNPCRFGNLKKLKNDRHCTAGSSLSSICIVDTSVKLY